MAYKNTGGRIEVTDQIKPLDFEKYTDSRIVVLIPAHNSEKSIAQVIGNLSIQTLPNRSHLHIVVCVNACSDNTFHVARKALRKVSTKNSKITNLLIATSQPGEPQALNRMLKKIDNEIVLVVNDDVLPTENSLASLYIAMRKNENIPAIGVPSRPFPEYRGQDQPLPIRLANYISKSHAENDITIIGRMYAFRRTIIDYFPNIMAEDDYLTYISLLKANCYGILHDGKSFVYFKPPSTFSDVFSQSLTYSRCGVQFFREYPDAWDLFLDIEGQMSMIIKKKLSDEDSEIKKIAKLIQDCTWRIANLSEKISPIKGSHRDRITSTI